MSSLIKVGIKDNNGKYQNYILSIQDEVDQYGNNVSMYVEQTKEERMAKARRTYVGNGRVIWSSDGKIEVAPNPNDSENKTEKINVGTPTAGPSIGDKPTLLEDLKEEPTPEDYKSTLDEASDDLPF